MAERKLPVTYLLQCADGSLYCGWTNDLPQRLAAHNKGQGAKYTRSRRPVTLAWWEPQPDRSTALKRERQIKALTRKQKLALIAAASPWQRRLPAERMYGMNQNHLEIERKFLLDCFPQQTPSYKAIMEQGYLTTKPTVRIRAIRDKEGSRYRLTIKGKGTLCRTEVELPLEESAYEALLPLPPLAPLVKEFRTFPLPDGLTLECNLVDPGSDTAFYYAEVEFDSREAAEAFVPPDFLGKELTGDKDFTMAAYWRRKLAALSAPDSKEKE